MDFDFEERNLEMEKESMTLNIDGLEIEIPEELIQERIDLLYLNDKEEAISDIKISLSGYISCLKEDDLKNPLINEKIISWLRGEVEIYKPKNKFDFDFMSGFSS